MNEPVNDAQHDALTLALYLGIVASDDQAAAEAADMAEQIAEGMEPYEVESCKERARRLVNRKDFWNEW
jgi:hypothetical protein